MQLKEAAAPLFGVLAAEKPARAGARRNRTDSGADPALEDLLPTRRTQMHRVALIVVAIHELIRLHDHIVPGLGVVMQGHVVHSVWHETMLDATSSGRSPLTDLVRAREKLVARMLRLGIAAHYPVFID